MRKGRMNVPWSVSADLFREIMEWDYLEPIPKNGTNLCYDEEAQMVHGFEDEVEYSQPQLWEAFCAWEERQGERVDERWREESGKWLELLGEG